MFRLRNAIAKLRRNMGRNNSERPEEVKKSNSIYDIKPDYKSAMDIRGDFPTMVCPCGCYIWNLKVSWDEEDGTIAAYFEDMECISCGTVATAPMPGVNIGLED
jgi:ferredoxin-like protein FixX